MLYARLMGWSDTDQKIPVHTFQALLGEFARGRITGAQAQAVIAAISGAALDAGEVTEAQALLASITGSVSAKLARALEIDHVLLLAEQRAPGYSTPDLVAARLAS